MDKWRQTPSIMQYWPKGKDSSKNIEEIASMKNAYGAPFFHSPSILRTRAHAEGWAQGKECDKEEGLVSAAPIWQGLNSCTRQKDLRASSCGRCFWKSLRTPQGKGQPEGPEAVEGTSGSPLGHPKGKGNLRGRWQVSQQKWNRASGSLPTSNTSIPHFIALCFFAL